MTIIVYDPFTDIIYADSKQTFFNGRAPLTATKVEKVGPHRGVFAGQALDSAAIANVIAEMITEGVTLRKMDKHFDVIGYVRVAAGDVRYVHMNDDQLVVVQAEKSFISGEGSGAYWFHGYLAIGMTTRDAINSVCKHHSDCGFPIDTI